MGKEQARANAAVEKALSSFSVKELEEIQTSDLPVKGGAMRLQVSCPTIGAWATSLLTLALHPTLPSTARPSRRRTSLSMAAPGRCTSSCLS